MKILYDHQTFALQDYGGISRYFYELIKRYRQTGSPKFELSLRYSNNQYLKNAQMAAYLTFFRNFNFRGKFRLMSMANSLRSRKSLLQQNFDIFHPTYYDPYFLKYLKKKPFVLTVHDMTHEIFSSQYPNRDKIAENKKLLVQKATQIIAVSENTKKDILKFHPGINEKKIVVIHLATSLSESNIPHLDIQLPAKYLLFVGNREKYKNFEFFIKSIGTLMAKDNELNVICAGGKDFSLTEKKTFKALKIQGKIHYFSVTDKILAWLYKNAIAFVFPSLYEGFGIPILEAFACGCPTIVSNAGSLPEIGGRAAVYFDPSTEDSIKETVSMVIYDEDIRQSLIEKGTERLKNFSWQKTAEQTEAVYRSIL